MSRGGGGGGRSAEQVQLERAQVEELKRLKEIEAKKTAAFSRGRRGRSSLISGTEAGIPRSPV